MVETIKILTRLSGVKQGFIVNAAEENNMLVSVDQYQQLPCRERIGRDKNGFGETDGSYCGSVQLLRRVRLFATRRTAAHQASLSITNSQNLFKLMSIESVMPSNHLALCHSLLLLLSIFPSIRVFSNESALHIRWPKYWSFSFSISPSNEYLGLISFWIDWLDLLAVQGTIKSLFQHRSSKATILWCSAFLQSSSHTHT